MAEKKIVNTSKAPAAVGPYSQAIVINGMIYTSGQLGIDTTTGKMVDGGVEKEAVQALKNLKTVLEEGGSSITSVIKTTVFLKDLNDFAKINKIYAEVFNENPPARSCIQAAALPLGGLFEIEAVGFIK